MRPPTAIIRSLCLNHLLSLVILSLILAGVTGCLPKAQATPTSPVAPSPTEQPSTSTAVPPAPTETATATLPPGSPTATPVLDSMQVNRSTVSSPSTAWIAQITTAFPKEGSGGENYYVQLKVTKRDRSLSWVVVDQWSRLGLGYTIPEPVRWSPDERYLYFTNRPIPEGCSLFFNASDLHRVDLSSGEITQIVPGVGSWLSLSPDVKTLVYYGFREASLTVRDLTTDHERALKLSPDSGLVQAIAAIVWSPDSSTFIMTVATDPCTGRPSKIVDAAATSIIRVDVATLKPAILINTDARLFITLDWPTAQRVQLEDKNGNHWHMDATTGEITQQ